MVYSSAKARLKPPVLYFTHLPSLVRVSTHAIASHVRSKKGTLDVQFGDGRKEKKVPMGLVRHESTDAPLLPPGKEQFVDDSILDKYMEPQDRKCNLDPQGTFMRYWDAYVAPALWLRSVPDQAASRCVALRRFAPNPV